MIERRSAGLSLAAVAMTACSGTHEDRLAEHWPLLDRYCVECHDDAEAAGGLSFQGVTPDHVVGNPELWEKVVLKLRGRVMPPPGGPRPDATEVDRFVAVLERTLDAAAEARGAEPGSVPWHRLNRSEYAAAVQGLLGVSVDVSQLLPPDAISDGFDNIAEVLRVTPTYLDQYIAAAREVSIRAVGRIEEPQRTEYVARLKNHTAHVDGLPLGTRGGLLVEHYFPVDGEYVFSLKVSSEVGAELRAYPQGWLDHRHAAILTIDGRKVFQAELGGADDLRDLDSQQISAVDAIKNRFRDIRVPVKAGYREVVATFIERNQAESDYLLQSLVPGEGIPDVPQMHGVEIVGPYDPAGISESTRSREKVFVCYPRNASEELPCAERILGEIARLAFRRGVTQSELDRLLVFYDEGQEAGGFERGIQKGLFAILASTNFLFRAAHGEPAGVSGPGAAHTITDLELASRLSFFLWNEGPDDELLTLAESSRLREPEIYAQQVQRLFDDSRSKSLVTNFAFQWLSVRDIDAIEPDPRLYPNFDYELRRAFVREMELFADSILRDESRSVVDLLTARHTFVNERLARHYGLSDVRGERFRRIELDDSRRWGVFGKGSVLLATSYPDRTSPVLRGAWIMEHMLGVPPTPPPPGVETNLTPVDELPRSVRERLEQHRAASACNHCHGVIDPLGQALENFDAVGEWRERERDSGVAVNPIGRLAGGRPVSGPDDLRDALSGEPEMFVQTVVRNLLAYALGRRVEYHDMPTVRSIVRGAAASNYSFSALVKGIANSVPFRMTMVSEASEDPLAVGPGEN